MRHERVFVAPLACCISIQLLLQLKRARHGYGLPTGTEESDWHAVDSADGDEVTLDYIDNAVAADAQTVILACVEAFGG